MVEFSLKPIILFFVVIIMGVVFLGVIADNQVANTEISGVTNESITITSGVGSTSNDDVVGISFFGNGTVGTPLATVTVGEHINFTKAGTIAIAQNLNLTSGGEDFNNSFADGSYNITYTYEGDLYVVDTKTHPLLKLLGLFFVLVIIAFGVQSMRDSSGNFSFGFNK